MSLVKRKDECTVCQYISYHNELLKSIRYRLLELCIIIWYLVCRFRGGSTNIKRALTSAFDNNFAASNGAREGVQKVLVLIADGESSDVKDISQVTSLIRLFCTNPYNKKNISLCTGIELCQPANRPGSVLLADQTLKIMDNSVFYINATLPKKSGQSTNY